MKFLLATLLFLGSAFAANAQSTQLPAFEVASIKLWNPQDQVGGGTARGHIFTQDPSFLSYPQISLKILLMRAYDLKPFQISGQDWLDSQLYVLSAKIPTGATQDQVPAMLQQLLTERFQMTLRWDTKQVTGYALMVDKDGPKLTLSADQSMPNDKPDVARSVSMSDKTRMTGAPIAALVNSLSYDLRAPISDSTDLQGRYDITLDVSFKDIVALQSGPSTTSDDTATSGTIFDAVHELGLRLQPQKMETKYLVVVKADRTPTEN